MPPEAHTRPRSEVTTLKISQDDAENFAAARIVQMHATGDGCAQCTGDGCRLWSWADQRLRQWETARRHPPAQSSPEWAPAWTPSGQ